MTVDRCLPRGAGPGDAVRAGAVRVRLNATVAQARLNPIDALRYE